MECFLCMRDDYYIYNINNIDVCVFCATYMDDMLKDRYEDMFYKKYMIYLYGTGPKTCKYCGWFIEKYNSSLHHCIIPMKNKYNNIIIL